MAQVTVAPVRRAGGMSAWRTVVLVLAAVVATTQVRLVLRAFMGVGVSPAVTWSALAIVAAVVFIARPTVYVGPVPGGCRHRYRRLEAAGVSLLAWSWTAIATALLVTVVGWIIGGSPLGDQALAAGTSLGTVVAETWHDAAVPAFAEELLFRYLLLGLLLAFLPVRRAVLVQAVAFGIAHTALGLGGGLIDSANSYPAIASIDTALAGLLFGFLTVELGSIWPAVIVHAVGNWLITVEHVAPWTVPLSAVLVAAGVAVATTRGVAGMSASVPIPRHSWRGVSVERQRRLLRRFGPLVGTSPELRRPIGWFAPTSMAQRADPDYGPTAVS